MVKTTDASDELKDRIGKKPTIHCQECGGGWWDDDLHARIMEAETVGEVDAAADGEVCPHCHAPQLR